VSAASSQLADPLGKGGLHEGTIFSDASKSGETSLLIDLSFPETVFIQRRFFAELVRGNFQEEILTKQRYSPYPDNMMARWKLIGGMNTPSLWISGERDSLLPPAYQDEAFRRFVSVLNPTLPRRDHEHHRLLGQSHMIPLTAPEAVAKRTASFLQRHIQQHA